MNRSKSAAAGLVFAIFAFPAVAFAARVSDVQDTDFWEQATRFFDWGDPHNGRYLMELTIGCALVGLCCGLLSAFIVVRRIALVGDMLSHAILPGIVLGFLWTATKNPVHLLIGAVTAGLVGAALATGLKRTTTLKDDTNFGIVLGGFYAVGIFLMSMIQNGNFGDQSGIGEILLGSAAAMRTADIKLIAVVAAVSVIVIGLLFKEFKASSFDPSFANTIGIKERGMHYLLMGLLSFVVVISIQAVGALLVTAMLIIPAATATLLTHRLEIVILLAVLFGMVASVGGAYFSFLHQGLPTGALMILTGSFGFSLAFIFAPERGLLPRKLRRKRQAARIQRENTLKAIFHLLEAAGFESDRVTFADLTARRRRGESEVRREFQNLARHGLVELNGASLRLTDAGLTRAKEIVRNHRLWELYLTHSADIAADHVHDDAEKIEHVLGENVVRLLEQRFGAEAIDPHGKTIPAAAGGSAS
ncbi:MAG: ABC-type Mn2+/Zn2+ transport system permease subunit [Verrucomicrobiales bacterium]|jgi:ABC-type Mn2+/Zn2+ transport system permease subunit/Mn-dependent DtxR family transcriptional regulator